MLIIESIHHVSLPVIDLKRSKDFYQNVLGLQEMWLPILQHSPKRGSIYPSSMIRSCVRRDSTPRETIESRK